MIVNGAIALIVAYLLGSIPSAYIITRLATGKDIRQLGGGNVGAQNVFREVGWRAGIPVLIFDVGKGAAAVAIAYWLLGAPLLFLLAAGLAVVAGHMWSIFLRFTGGNGLATTIGVLSVLMTRELLIALGHDTPIHSYYPQCRTVGQYQPPSFGACICLVSGEIMATCYLFYCSGTDTGASLPTYSQSSFSQGRKQRKSFC